MKIIKHGNEIRVEFDESFSLEVKEETNYSYSPYTITTTWTLKYFDMNYKTIYNFSRKEIKSFNLDGVYDFWSQVKANKEGKINTWAIFWYATIFKNNGLCLNPVRTFVKNIGLDESGTHCGKNKS